LFVFHLPNELTNYDLYLLFRKFGTILSVHTMINKNTGLSRGFGFVSFTTEDAAIAAVRAMDGFRLGKKRLKVQRKREHDGDFGVNYEEDFALMSHESEFGGGSGAGGTPGIFGMPSPYASGLMSPPAQGYSLSGGGGNITLRDIAPPNPYHQQQQLQAQLQHQQQQQQHLHHAHAQQQQQQQQVLSGSFVIRCSLLPPNTPHCLFPSPSF
jgi:RNA recognition motif-containing protein